MLETQWDGLTRRKLVVQVPQSAGGTGAETENARMRVQIDVSGEWQVTK